MLARTRNRLATGNEGIGNRLTLKERVGKSCWPNEAKLSDRHRRSQAWDTQKTRMPVPVRWSAWLGDFGCVGAENDMSVLGVWLKHSPEFVLERGCSRAREYIEAKIWTERDLETIYSVAGDSGNVVHDSLELGVESNRQTVEPAFSACVPIVWLVGIGVAVEIA